MGKINLFDIEFDNFNFKDFSNYIDEAIKRKEPKYIVTCNVDHVVKMKKNQNFSIVYKKADAIVVDGMPILWTSKLKRTPLKQKISGSDILPTLGDHFAEKKYKLFFLGGEEGIAEKAKDNLQKVFNDLNVVGCYSPPYGFEKSMEENAKLISLLKKAKPDILFVGLGAPKQELWISQYYKEYDVPISIGIGGTFDLLSGNLRRAPKLIQKLGLEWFWRLIQEPGRLWKRYIIEDSMFILLFIKELINRTKAKKN